MLSMEYPAGGPWMIGPEGGREGGRWRIADKDNWFIAVITNTAKAHLISAAPEMLAKLEEVRDMMLDQFGESEGVYQLDVIIAKATGETIPVYDGPGPALVFDSPSAFIEVKLAPEPQCRCGHTELEHRIDKTCGKVPCLCIRFFPAYYPDYDDSQGNEHAEL